MTVPFKIAIACLASAAIFGCAQQQGDDRLKEKADIDAKGTQDATDKRAKELEARLSRQQRFYQATAGVFNGRMKFDSGHVYDVRLQLTPTIQRYDGQRVRTIEEITYDLTNLGLNIEASMSTKLENGKPFSSGCTFSNVKPKVDEGFILASSENCSVTFTISLGDKAGATNKNGKLKETSESVSKKVLDGEIDVMYRLNVELRSVHRAGTQKFEVLRSNEGLR